MIWDGSATKVLAGEVSDARIVARSIRPLPSAASIGIAALSGSALISATARTTRLTSVCAAAGSRASQAPDAATTVPGWLGNISPPSATIFRRLSRWVTIVTAGSRTVAPSTAPVSSACWVASMPIGTISTSALSAFATSHSQCCRVVLGTEPAGWVARRTGLPLAARSAAIALAAGTPGLNSAASLAPAIITISSTAVAVSTRTSMPLARATARGATPAT